MKTGIGIDTGGTYTDAVVYDFEKQKILAAAKALTTKEKLEVGIGNALDGLPGFLLHAAEIVSLSTTLATNACVEEKGGRGKLIFIGADKDIVIRTGKKYGLPDTREIYFLDGEINLKGEVVREPDWQSFLHNSKEWMGDADAVAVVQQLGIRNSECERKAKDFITKEFGLTTICGYELFSDLNYIKRGASTLLNARLVPVIGHFLKAIKQSLAARKICAPVVIVRSDGSVMSESFTTIRPVETLLCGPAASVMGGVELTGKQDCVIVDMGGTTTDMALVKDGIPVKAKDGVNVGRWQTFVKAVSIDTFGLGGDSCVRFTHNGSLNLKPFRVMPLSIAANRWPQICEKLQALLASGNESAAPLHEFVCLIEDIGGSKNYSKEERLLCEALKGGPLIVSEISAVIGKRLYEAYLDRLEREGVIMRCGLTPTDLMHLKGDFTRFNTEAARLGARFVASRMRISVDTLIEQVYDEVKKTLYFNIIRMLLEDRYPFYKKNGLDENLKTLITQSWEQSKGTQTAHFLQFTFHCPVSLVGVGAPTHIFLPDVAHALGTDCTIPENAGVANALGAIVGNIAATSEIQIKSEFAVGGSSGYIVFGRTENRHAVSMDEAIKIAVSEAREAAVSEARRRGAAGDVAVTVNTDHVQEIAGVLLDAKITATAIGRVVL